MKKFRKGSDSPNGFHDTESDEYESLEIQRNLRWKAIVMISLTLSVIIGPIIVAALEKSLYRQITEYSFQRSIFDLYILGCSSTIFFSCRLKWTRRPFFICLALTIFASFTIVKATLFENFNDKYSLSIFIWIAALSMIQMVVVLFRELRNKSSQSGPINQLGSSTDHLLSDQLHDHQVDEEAGAERTTTTTKALLSAPAKGVYQKLPGHEAGIEEIDKRYI